MRPNFFIIGAPKCGTTSLANWLKDHPQVFLSTPKEPQYFNKDYKAQYRPKDIQEYELLFQQAGNCLAIGEASTGYLVSEVAVPELLKYCSRAKIIVCLRNPVSMVPSLHAQRLKEGVESKADIKHAWELQETRQAGHQIPLTCIDKKLLMYGEYCLLGKQIERLLQRVSSEQIHFTFLEDIRLQPESTYKKITDFLEVDDWSCNFNIHNAGTVPRFLYISRGVKSLVLLKQRLGLKSKFGLGSWINKMNAIERPKGNVPSEFENVLKDFFKQDIRKIERMTGKKLSHWL